MKIRVLGCSGSIAAGNRTTAFLLDDDVLIDAGTGVGDLTLDEMARVDHIFISHSHLDHVLAIGLLADSVSRRRDDRGPIHVHALSATLNALRTHLFNGIIWPDFTRLPTLEAPLLSFSPFAIGDLMSFGERRIEILPAEHTVPACGFALMGAGEGSPAWVYTGDTGPNPALWRRLQQLNVAHLVIETAFSDGELPLAQLSAHLSPCLLANELSHLPVDSGTTVHITHIKPGENDDVMGQIAAQVTKHRVGTLAPGQVFSL